MTLEQRVEVLEEKMQVIQERIEAKEENLALARAAISQAAKKGIEDILAEKA